MFEKERGRIGARALWASPWWISVVLHLSHFYVGFTSQSESQFLAGNAARRWVGVGWMRRPGSPVFPLVLAGEPGLGIDAQL